MLVDTLPSFPIDPAINTTLSFGTRMFFDPADQLLKVAGSGVAGVGTLINTYVPGNGDSTVAVLPWNAQGTRKMVASGAIAPGAEFSFSANGKIQTEGTPANANGQNLNRAATADGDILIVLPLRV